MKPAMRLIVALALVSSYGCQATPASTNSTGNSKCLHAVKKHVEETRGWTSDKYTIKEEMVDENLKGYEVMFLEDLQSKPPTELKSFHVDLDQNCERVIRELGYQ